MTISQDNCTKLIVVLLTLTTSVSCDQLNRTVPTARPFTLPVISQPRIMHSVSFFEANCIAHSWPVFAVKRKFCDTLKLSLNRDRDTTLRSDYVNDRELWYSDTLETDGLELFSDYKSTVVKTDRWSEKGKRYYPVYVVNQTPRTKICIGKDSHVFAIQEALDTNRNWRPIEGRGFDFCGEGYWGLRLSPDEFLTFLMPKYAGTYKTKIRVRLKIGDIIYVSKSFWGLINKQQFYLDREHSYHYNQLVESRASAIQHLFYGAEPLEVEDENFGVHAAWQGRHNYK